MSLQKWSLKNRLPVNHKNKLAECDIYYDVQYVKKNCIFRLESSINKAFEKASFLLSKTKLLAHSEALFQDDFNLLIINMINYKALSDNLTQFWTGSIFQNTGYFNV